MHSSDRAHNRSFPDADELTGTLRRVVGEMQSCSGTDPEAVILCVYGLNSPGCCAPGLSKPVTRYRGYWSTEGGRLRGVGLSHLSDWLTETSSELASCNDRKGPKSLSGC